MSADVPSRGPASEPSSTGEGRRAVVTGAAGFIGSHLVEALLAQGWDVLGIDAFTDSYDPARKRANLAPSIARPRFALVQGDLRLLDLTPLLAGAEAVFHLAGEAGVGGSWGEGFERYGDRNIVATQRLLEAAGRAGVGRLVYASSSSVYGHRVGLPAAEDDPPAPTSPYGVSKLAGEHLVSAYVRAKGLAAVSLRYFSVYGPRQRPDMALHRFVAAALAGEPVTLHGSGEQVRDFTYVSDVVAATLAAARAPLRPGEVVNVGAGSGLSLIEVLRVLAALTGLRPSVVSTPPCPGDVAWTRAATGRARRVLGWAPITDFSAGLAMQVAWQRRAARRPRPETSRPVALRSAGSPGKPTTVAAASPA